MRSNNLFQGAAALLLMALLASTQHSLAAHSKVDWPARIQPLSETRLPAVVDGVPHGFLGATFHITAFDSTTTILRGFIDLTNLTDSARSIVLCLDGPTIAYHLEMIDSQDNLLFDPEGAAHNWKAKAYQFSPHEAKRESFKIRLKDFFDVKPGYSQLLFTFDERMVRPLAPGEYPIKAWSRERIIIEIR